MTRQQTNDFTNAAMSTSNSREMNEAFNIFLGISEPEKALLAHYHSILTQGADRFIEAFYAYLLAFPITANVLHHYQEAGGELSQSNTTGEAGGLKLRAPQRRP
ncbi:hypothetical protein SFMTTN_2440 [Sulfuriferula multivorans]|uniref:Uncharacterized protein n=1 Tax=Sulfuriferula multivorans TaxID=1559896 RepID=A0A401JG79_9PROT|nr:hypothetical protein [Sulfuriferula multivorans]GBL46624.1 hypothetical protein SFMTTN_2440 [Sulfuriferula multivorans]